MRTIYKDGDPIKDKLLREQLAAARAGMMEGKVQVGDDYMELPYPSSWAGTIEYDKPYLAEIVGITGAPMKMALRKGSKAVVSRGGNEAIDAMRREAISDFSERMAGKRALEAVKETQAKSRLQSVADRAIRDASRDESQQILRLQQSIDDALMAGKIEEDIAEKLFQEGVDDIFMQAKVDDVLLGQTERVPKNMGPTMRELYEKDPSLFDQIWFKELIEPSTRRKINGVVNPKMNQFGGKISIVK